MKLKDNLQFQYVNVELTEEQFDYLFRCFRLMTHNKPYNNHPNILMNAMVREDLVKIK